MKKTDSLLLVDGMALLFRGFYATSYRGQFMETSKGVPTNAIFGFVRYLWDAIGRFEPSHIICCWDMGSQTFRNEMFPDYKANRGEAPAELIPQFELVKEVSDSFSILNVGVRGYEADDVIGTLAKNLCSDIDVRILTGDRDSLQLVNDNVHAVIMNKGIGNYTVYTPELIKETIGVTPAQLIDIKGLMGDSSDNFPGVPGIGEKTAIKLIKEHHSIEGILENQDKLTKGIQKKLSENLEILHLSRKLAEIYCEVPMSCSLEECFWKFDIRKATEMLERIESNRLVKLIEQHAEKVSL
jgi:5'-3' exonuclease